MKETPNLIFINKLSQGDEIFFQNIVNVIKKELPLEIEAYRLNFEKQDWQRTGEDVHKLKHKISILGLEKGYQIAIDYENNLIEGNLELKSSFEEILEVMLRFMDNL